MPSNNSSLSRRSARPLTERCLDSVLAQADSWDMTRRAPRGFLVEMMVVIAIVAVLSGVMISISRSAYGANAISDPLTSALGFARLRAIATGRYTHVEVKARAATVWQSTHPGVVTPTAWQFCQSFTIPNDATVVDGATAAYARPGMTGSQNPSVSFTIDFRPDGASTGGTLFVIDAATAGPHRRAADRGAGPAYARTSW